MDHKDVEDLLEMAETLTRMIRRLCAEARTHEDLRLRARTFTLTSDLPVYAESRLDEDGA